MTLNLNPPGFILPAEGSKVKDEEGWQAQKLFIPVSSCILMKEFEIFEQLGKSVLERGGGEHISLGC